MNELRIRFLGDSKIFFNEMELRLPFIKAYGVLYCIGLEKSISRDKLCTYFWNSNDEKNAKKNLRNAVYTIRKKTSDNLIVSPKRESLMFSEELSVDSDVDYIINFNPNSMFSDEELIRLLEIYKGDMLEGFKYHDSDDFNSWIRFNQIRIKKLYISKLDNCISKLIENQNFHLAELCCEKIIRIDEYEELGYQLLMKIYEHQGKLKECSQLYNRLTNMLNEELAVEPSETSKEIYNKIILNKAGNRISSNGSFFYGRKYEFDILVKNYSQFIKNEEFYSYIITGEPGIGKTRLMEETGKYVKESILINISSYEIEKEYHYKLWDNIFEKLMKEIINTDVELDEKVLEVLSNYFVSINEFTGKNVRRDFIYSKNTVEEYVVELFSMICRKCKIVFFIDDIQWADNSSIELLEKILFFNKNQIMLIATYRNGINDEYDKFYFNLFKLDIIKNINLKRFSVDETSEFIYVYMPKLKNYSGLIYKESEGNPLFIVEIINNIKSGLSLNNLSDKLVRTIGGRIINLDKKSKTMLSICSVFHKTFSVNMLSKITSRNEMEIAETVEELVLNNIIKESISAKGEIVLDFTHQKIREFVYSQISLSKRGVIHNKIAGIIEKKLVGKQSDLMYYPELIYHYKMCENKIALFKYKVLNLFRILDITHEVFPIYQQERVFNYSQLYMTELELENELMELGKLYEQLKIFESETIVDDYILYLFVLGRYYKNKGDQDKGLTTLENMIDIAKERKNFKYIFEGYVQLIQNSININDIESMKRYIAEIEFTDKSLDGIELARFLIYKGYYEILSKNYSEGEAILNKAKDIFEKSGNMKFYILNISAIYMYLGESKFMQNRLDDAFDLFSNALNICDEKEDVSSLSIILSKLGIIKYCIGKKNEAMYYLSKSLEYYDKTIFIWGRIQTYYYLSKLYFEREMISQAIEFLDQAMKYSNLFDDNMNDKIKKLRNQINECSNS